MSKSLDGQYAKDILFALAKKLGYNRVVRKNYKTCYSLLLIGDYNKHGGLVTIINNNSQLKDPPAIPFTFQSAKWINILNELEGKIIITWHQKDTKFCIEKIPIDSIEGLIITLQLEGHLPT